MCFLPFFCLFLSLVCLLRPRNPPPTQTPVQLKCPSARSRLPSSLFLSHTHASIHPTHTSHAAPILGREGEGDADRFATTAAAFLPATAAAATAPTLGEPPLLLVFSSASSSGSVGRSAPRAARTAAKASVFWW